MKVYKIMFMFHAFWNLIGSYTTCFPLIIFLGLLLGGFNMPISEDILVVTAALIGKSDKASTPALYSAVLCGAVVSDYLVYFWGHLLSKGLISTGFFSKIIKLRNSTFISKSLEKHGFLTFFVGRFIPFGVRNVMSMTAGFVGFNFYKFMVFDAIAAVCNISLLFWLVYFFGEKGNNFVRVSGILLFLVLAGIGIYLVISGKLLIFTESNIKEKKQNLCASETE